MKGDGGEERSHNGLFLALVASNIAVAGVIDKHNSQSKQEAVGSRRKQLEERDARQRSSTKLRLQSKCCYIIIA